MIDLHTHSLFSDGALIPSELIRRLEAMGYLAAAITDHVDSSNLDHVVPRIVRVAEELNHAQSVKVIPGVELTHVPPVFIPSLVRRAREMGARLVLNSDSHAPADFMSEAFAQKVTQGAGLPSDSLHHLQSNSRLLLGGIGFPL
jgi:histidinol phosphatase-like PHP family hydrolase